MKLLLTITVTMASIIASAGPQTEPGPLKTISSEATTVLIYGAPNAKIAALKKDTNTLSVEQQNLRPGLTRFTYTARQCMKVSVGNQMVDQCLGGKRLLVTRTEGVVGAVSYEASEVILLRSR